METGWMFVSIKVCQYEQEGLMMSAEKDSHVGESVIRVSYGRTGLQSWAERVSGGFHLI